LRRRSGHGLCVTWPNRIQGNVTHGQTRRNRKRKAASTCIRISFDMPRSTRPANYLSPPERESHDTSLLVNIISNNLARKGS
jgi:hypothetical protein